jgi:hypothetical protein
MTLDEQMTFFFAPPTPRQSGPAMSTLHLVRREVQDCLINTVTDEDQVVEAALHAPHRLFATTMVMLAGIDLLAKFHAGSDMPRGVATRIEKFTSQYIFPGDPSAERLAKVLYEGLRNPLMHSFTLYDAKEKRTILLANRRPTSS